MTSCLHARLLYFVRYLEYTVLVLFMLRWFVKQRRVVRPWRSSRYIRSLLSASGVRPNSKCATPLLGSKHAATGLSGAKTKHQSKATSSSGSPALNQNQIAGHGAGSSPASDDGASSSAYVNPNIGRLRYSNAGPLGTDPQYRQTLLQTGTRALDTVCNMSTIPMMEALHDEEQQRANEPANADSHQADESLDELTEPDGVHIAVGNGNGNGNGLQKPVHVEVIGEHENWERANNHTDDDAVQHHHYLHRPAASAPSDLQLRAMSGQTNGETNGHLVNSTNLAGFKAGHQPHHQMLVGADGTGTKFAHFEHHLIEDEEHVDSENEALSPLDTDADHEDHDLSPSALPPRNLKRQQEIERLMSSDTESSSARIFQYIQRKHADQQQANERHRANTNPNGIQRFHDAKHARSHSPVPVPEPIGDGDDAARPKKPTVTMTTNTDDEEDEDNPVLFTVHAGANRELMNTDGAAHFNNSAVLTGAFFIRDWGELHKPLDHNPQPHCLSPVDRV